MAKVVVIDLHATPDEQGFRDSLCVTDGRTLFACPCRSGPNWVTPYAKGRRPWREAYDWIAPGTHRWEFVWHLRYGWCLSINGGGEVPSRNPVSNPDGSTFRGVFLHKAQSDKWSGSAGCPTIQRVYWPAFLSMFRRGDRGLLHVNDLIETGG